MANASSMSLSGEQDGVYEKGSYVVSEDIVVREGMTLTFLPGTVVRFEPYAGIVVRGALVCTGEPTAPVVFTSADDRPSSEGPRAQPQPFDWNGIRIERKGRAELAYVKVSYSTYGIEADTSGALRLREVVFVKNGRSSLVIGGEIVAVEDAKPFGYDRRAANTEPQVAPQPEVPAAAPPREHRKGQWKLPVRIGLGVVAAAGGAMWAGFHYRAVKSQEEYESAVYPRADEYRRERDRAVGVRNVGAVISGVGVVGFGVTFAF
jgi:hypothetical protein